MPLNPQQAALCSENKTDFSDLKAVTVNCSLKRNPDESHTGLLLSVAEEIMRKNGVAVEHIHALSHQIPSGVYPDMTEHGWDRDDWPKLWKTVEAADILIVATPIWLGEESSVCRILIERLYGMSGMLNDKGQSLYYGKVGGTVITGNEDGVKHCAMSILYCASASRLHHPAAGRLRLDRRGGAGAVLWRSTWRVALPGSTTISPSATPRS